MWPNLQETVDLVTVTEEILNEKLHFLCSDPILFDSYVMLIWNSVIRTKLQFNFQVRLGLIQINPIYRL